MEAEFTESTEDKGTAGTGSHVAFTITDNCLLTGGARAIRYI